MRRCSVMLFCLYLFLMCVNVARVSASPITQHDRNVIRFFHNHPQLAATPAGAKALINVLPHVVRALEAATVSWPPHHQLWLCEHANEASDWHNQDTGGNGHWGGLQMHPGWGYGTSYHASDDSQYTQEWAAEKAFQANGYSTSWLLGQWAHSQCLAYV